MISKISSTPAEDAVIAIETLKQGWITVFNALIEGIARDQKMPIDTMLFLDCAKTVLGLELWTQVILRWYSWNSIIPFVISTRLKQV
ncbi:hypothetical protein COY07_00265, partial [Candidatus Peregrinibacteria bacterium CG_4_10_14_0_2_um_filter_43_11]